MSTSYQKDFTQWIFIWMVCNAKCGFCNAQISNIENENVWLRKESDYQVFYNFERIKKDIIFKKDNWAWCIIYEGWDFSIHPEIFKILEFWKSLWLKQTFQTNWIRLSDINFVRKLKEIWIEDMNFSLHAYEEKVSDKIMQVDWAFKKTINWLINCKKEGINIIVNFVLIKENLNQLEWFMLLIFKLGVNLLNLTMYVPVDLFSDEFHNKYLVNPKNAWIEITKMLKIYEELIQLSENKIKLNLKFHNIWRCIFDTKFHNYDFQFDLDRRKANNEDYNFDTWFYKKKECEKCFYFNDCTWFTSKYIIEFWDDYMVPIIHNNKNIIWS